MSLAPSTPPAETHALLTLMDVLSDPEKTKAKLAEIERVRQGAADGMKELEAKAAAYEEEHAQRKKFLAEWDAKLQAKQDEVDQAKNKLESDVADHLRTVASKLDELDGRDAASKQQAQQLAEQLADVAQREQAVAAKEATLTQAEKDLAVRQEAAEKLHAQGTRLVAVHQDKIAKLQKIVNDETFRQFNTGA